MITSLSALSLHQIHSTQSGVHAQLSLHNLTQSSTIPSQASTNLPQSHSQPATQQNSNGLITSPIHNIQPPALQIARCDGLLLRTRDAAQWDKVEEVMEMWPTTVKVGQQCMAAEYVPFMQLMFEYEERNQRSSTKRKFVPFPPYLPIPFLLSSLPPLPTWNWGLRTVLEVKGETDKIRKYVQFYCQKMA